MLKNNVFFFFKLNSLLFFNNYLYEFFFKKIHINNYSDTKKKFSKNFLNLNFLKIFKFIFLVNLNVSNFDFKNIYFYKNNKNINFINIFFFLKNFKFFFNFIHFSTMNKKNFLILDNYNNFLFPLYNYMYGYKNLYNYKDFFFLLNKYFTYRNWMYFYSSFLKKFNIEILIIFDLYKYLNYYKDIKSLNIFLISIVLIENIQFNIDISLLTNKKLYFLMKYLYLIILFNSYFSALNFNKLKKQLLIFKNF